MARIRRKRSGGIHKGAWLVIFPAIIALSAVIFFWSRDLAAKLAGDFVYPFSAIPADLMRKVREEGLSVRTPVELAAAVEVLRRDNLLLAAKAKNTAALESEIAVLRSMCELKPDNGFSYTVSEVIRRDPVNWYESFSIDKGSDSGVAVGAGVFTIASINGAPVSVFVGVVSEVSRHQAIVRTILNSSMRFSVRLPESDAVGFINADGQAGSINFLPGDRSYRIGEEVVTTGFEEAIPSGVIVGHLEDLESHNTVYGNSMVRSGKIRISADLNTMRYVAVAIAENNGREADEEADGIAAE